jgi:thiosulfate/3-mercaptopyruvate sulfurtransferase
VNAELAARAPLISVSELAGEMPGPAGDDLVVVDVRWYLGRPGDGRRAYLDGHIPGAIHLDLDDDLTDLGGLGAPGRHPLPSPADFAARLAQAGVGDATLVVAYDDAGGWVAARRWWMLDNLGHNRPGRGGVAVLDGGWKAWTEAGLPVSTDVPRALDPSAGTAIHLDDRWTNVILRDDLRDRLGSLVLLDARAAPRYRGEVEPIDPVAGHIPTAISAPWDGDVGPDGRLLPRDSLRDRFASVGITDAATVVTSCGSGTSACLHSLAMRAAGLPDPVLYVGSYSDWSRSGYPVATGPEPGPPPEPASPATKP